MNRLVRTKTAVTAVVAPLPFGVASCSNAADPVAESTVSSAPSASIDQQGSETVNETHPDATEGATETVTEAAAPAPAGQNEASLDGECATLPNDPRTQYPSGSAPGRMPNVDGSDYNYWIEDVENHYDPCAPLSYVIFHGSLGDLRGRSGMAGSITDGIAFYVNGIPDGEMRTFSRIEKVERVAPDRVRLAWGEPGAGTAAGITDHYEVVVQTNGSKVEAARDGDYAKFEEQWHTDYGEYMLGTYD